MDFSKQTAPFEAAAQRRHRRLDAVEQQRDDLRQALELHAPQRDADAVIQLQAVRQRRLEAAAHRLIGEMHRQAGMAGDRLVREGLHPQLGRALVLLAHADAYGRIVIEKEVRPMVGRHDDQHVGLRRAESAAELAERGAHPGFFVLRNSIPLAHDERSVARGEGADQASHGSIAG